MLKLLREGNVQEFNKMRESNSAILAEPVFSMEKLDGAHIAGANLSNANLNKVDLSGADLEGANLSNTNLFRANLEATNLSKTNCSNAVLKNSHANLSKANLSHAKIDRIMKGTSRYSLLLVIFLFYMPFVLFTVYQDNPQIHNFHRKLFYLYCKLFFCTFWYVVIYFWYRQKEKRFYSNKSR
jgi:hypothetical protein